ncbi:MAG: dephospho-CoA kinase [Gammaproteobacteria bacterium]
MTLVVGLTGGVGSGKSTVAQYFAQQGVPIIDTDTLARDVVKPGTPALAAIVQHFGASILLPQGMLNRAALRQCIFDHPEHRLWLENLLHPLIRKELSRKITSLTTPYCVVMIPLLVENYPHPLVDRILVIDVDESLQMQRTMERDHCSEAAALKIIQSQLPSKERLHYAHDVITNNEDRNHLAIQVKQLHQLYSRLAQSSL